MVSEVSFLVLQDEKKKKKPKPVTHVCLALLAEVIYCFGLAIICLLAHIHPYKGEEKQKGKDRHTKSPETGPVIPVHIPPKNPTHQLFISNKKASHYQT
jgi:hypothetical protein